METTNAVLQTVLVLGLVASPILWALLQRLVDGPDYCQDCDAEGRLEPWTMQKEGRNLCHAHGCHGRAAVAAQ